MQFIVGDYPQLADNERKCMIQSVKMIFFVIFPVILNIFLCDD